MDLGNRGGGRGESNCSRDIMYEKKKTLRGILKKERKKRKRKASQPDRQKEGKQASLA